MLDRLLARLAHTTAHRRSKFARITALADAPWRTGMIAGAYIKTSERGINAALGEIGFCVQSREWMVCRWWNLPVVDKIGLLTRSTNEGEALENHIKVALGLSGVEVVHQEEVGPGVIRVMVARRERSAVCPICRRVTTKVHDTRTGESRSALTRPVCQPGRVASPLRLLALSGDVHRRRSNLRAPTLLAGRRQSGAARDLIPVGCGSGS
jgi:hypothetical protein